MSRNKLNLSFILGIILVIVFLTPIMLKLNNEKVKKIKKSNEKLINENTTLNKANRLKNSQIDLKDDQIEYLKNQLLIKDNELAALKKSYERKIEQMTNDHQIEKYELSKSIRNELKGEVAFAESQLKTAKKQIEKDTKQFEAEINELRNIKSELDNLNWKYEQEKKDHENDMAILRQENHDLNEKIKKLKSKK